MILGILTVGSLIWYLVSTPRSGDLQLIGTVDANEVIVSSKIPGRIQSLTVQEGEPVKAGQLIATIESEDLQAALDAAKAAAISQRWKLRQTEETERQNAGETQSATISAEAQVKAAQATLDQAQAQYEHQQADTSRTVALANQGIMSTQARDEQQTALSAAKAAVDTARHNLAAARVTYASHGTRRRRLTCRRIQCQSARRTSGHRAELRAGRRTHQRAHRCVGSA